MRVTGVGKPTCDVECIYRLIGKTPYSVTTLKDLKDAAQKSGFSAVGYKLTLTQLQNLNEYAILPIGFAQGTSDDPFHFILVQPGANGYLNIINTTTLKRNHITFSQLQNSWTGYALVLSLPAILPEVPTF
jgi:ABC-type bacteriocin/lantibiotic exporter with double-glycine peptidase domain